MRAAIRRWLRIAALMAAAGVVGTLGARLYRGAPLLTPPAFMATKALDEPAPGGAPLLDATSAIPQAEVTLPPRETIPNDARPMKHASPR